MVSTCSQSECTIAQTNICLLNNDPGTCPHRQASIEAKIENKGLAPVLPSPEVGVRLDASLTMGGDAVRAYLGRHLCTQVGVLGFPDAGKTAALVSLYLLVSRNMLEGFEFRDCRTLMAFEQISRGARAWDENVLPDQITAHTESADGRTAGFLHFKVYDIELQRDVEFIVPDLPGEWTTAFVDENRRDRLEFLRAADVLWLFVNGEQIADSATRGHAVHRTELVIRRTAALLGDDIKPPLAIVVTRRDEGQPNQAALDSLIQCATTNGFSSTSIEVASVSKSPEVAPAGTGLVNLVKTLRPDARIEQGVLSDERRSGFRFAMNFRNS
jgi:hypothetical protein